MSFVQFGAQAFASQAKTAELVLVGRVPEIMQISTQVTQSKFELATQESGIAKIGILSAQSNGSFSQISLVSKTKSGVPEYRGVPLTAYGGSFRLKLKECNGLSGDRLLTFKKGRVELGSSIKNCPLAAEWQTREKLPPGSYVMDLIVEMVSS